MSEYCDCHLKHAAEIAHLREDKKESHEDHGKMWDSIKDKIDKRWLFALIPILIAWAGSQAAVYKTVKDIEKKVAVIETKVDLHIKISE